MRRSYLKGRDWFLGNASRIAGTTIPLTGIVYSISVNSERTRTLKVPGNL